MTTPRTAYRENDARGATSLRLVVLLHDQIIQDLTQAAHAFDHNDIELRTKMLNHAILVIAYLQSPLDFVRGGKVAKDLERFYNHLRQSLVQVQFFPSAKGIREHITDVQALRAAWIEVDRAELAASKDESSAASPIPATPGVAAGRIDWEG